MKNCISLCLFFFIVAQLGAKTRRVDSVDKPRIKILATGGTIAGSQKTDDKVGYKAGELSVDNLLNAVPELKSMAVIKTEQIANIGSQDMTVSIWLKLAKRINSIFKNDGADGVVITHGTDTMEETAYFLSLTVHSDKPVVLVGAMRPATALSQDGNRNLHDAVRVAASPKSRNVGAVVVMNERIFAARDVTKTSTTNVNAFRSNEFGPIGLVHNHELTYYYQSLHRPAEEFDVSNRQTLPDVEIAYGYADASPVAIDAFVKNGAKGLIFAGVGNGNYNKPVGLALQKAVNKGVIVCRAARVGSGRVTRNNEVDDDKLGFVVPDNLNPQKARILLMLALTKTHEIKAIQKMFYTY